MSIIRPLTYYPTGFGKQLAATIVWSQVFTLYCIVFWALSTPIESNVQWADPFIKIFPIQTSVWLLIVTSLAMGMWCYQWLGRELLLKHTALVQMMSGVATAIAIAVAIRLIVGENLPDFIPAEESSRPGFLYGMVAGYGEEVFFRMILTPLFFFTTYSVLKDMEDRKRVLLSITVAILLTAVSFVLLHELGEADGTVIWKLVATRFMVPGIVMGVLYFLFGPGFLITMHATMHIMIPLLFH